jgi:hypothetical protein
MDNQELRLDWRVIHASKSAKRQRLISPASYAKMRAKNKVWAANNREKINARRRSCYAKDGGAYAHARYMRSLTRFLVWNAKCRAKKHGLPFALNWRDVKAIVDRGVCERTGIAFEVGRGVRGPWSPSLDRTDPRKGYVKSNVRIVCVALNLARGDWGDGPMIRMMKALAKAECIRLEDN